MFRAVSPEKAIEFTWLFTCLSFCWPPPIKAEKYQVTRFKILRATSVISGIMLLLPLIYAIYLHIDDADVIIVVKSICIALGAFQIVVQTIFCSTQYNRLQYLINEMLDYCQNAVKYQRDILESYVNKCGVFYGVSVCFFYISATMVIVGTLLISQPFPTDAEYPFRVDYEPLRSLIFLHQSFAGFQCASHVCLGAVGALLLWFAAARFEVIRVEMRDVNSVESLIECVKKHQHARRYASEVALAVRYIALISVALSASALILCGVTFISKQPLTVKVQFLFLSGTALVEVYMCAWPADHLMDMSIDVVEGAYDSMWYEHTLLMQKIIIYILAPQKPVCVSVPCVMPVMSLQYYSSYLSTAFSTFTTLRFVLNREN